MPTIKVKDNGVWKDVTNSYTHNHTIDEIINLSESIPQSDWNQNDETASDYIKNRTHWSAVENVTFIDNETFAFSNSGNIYIAQFESATPLLQEGKTYTFTIDGTNFECTAYIFEAYGLVCIGNLNLADASLEDTGEPFLMYHMGIGANNITIGTTLEGDSHVISLSGNVLVYHKIDENYLPTMIGKQGTADGAEIFNNYENNVASGGYAHAEGASTDATGNYSHAEGNRSTASNHCAHAEGQDTIASGSISHAEGSDTTASGNFSHAEGSSTTASGNSSHAEGVCTIAAGNYSHVENSNTYASGECSHAEGDYTLASGASSHAEGNHEVIKINLTGEANATTFEIVGGLDATIYKGILVPGIQVYYSFRKRYITQITITDNIITHITVDDYLSSSAITNKAVEVYIGSMAKGNTSHAEGLSTIASGDNQHAQGKFNIEDSDSKYAHIVGNGSSATVRSNAHTVDWNGVGWYQGGLQVGGNAQDDGAKNVLLEGDAIPVPASAAIGQTIVVKAVDENGKPTEWECANMPSDEWIEITSGAISEETASIVISQDANGTALSGLGVNELMIFGRIYLTGNSKVRYEVNGNWTVGNYGETEELGAWSAPFVVHQKRIGGKVVTLYNNSPLTTTSDTTIGSFEFHCVTDGVMFGTGTHINAYYK